MTSDSTQTTPAQAKREAILEQAIATFADEGFRNADVQVIADKAGVGKGTVYRYFGNKEDLFWASTFAVLERLQQHLVAAVEPVQGNEAKLRATGRAYAGFFEANPLYLEVFVQQRAQFRGVSPDSHVEYHHRLIDHFAAFIEAGVAAGEFRPVEPKNTLLALGDLLYGTVVQSCYSNIDQTLGEAAEYAMEIFFEGIRAKS